MPDATPGQFIWYDLLTNDPPAALTFYEHVVGWTSQPMQGGAPYTLFVGSQGPMAGTANLPEQARKMGAPPHWTSNVEVADIHATCELVKKLGGKILVEPSQYAGVGWVGVMADPQGATINLFSPAHPQKLHDRSKPGEFIWHEVLTTDHESAFVFYSRIFGWKKQRDFDMGAMGKYLIYGLGDEDLGGMFTKSKDMPMPPSWIYYIQVAELDAAVERAKAKGAKLMNGPMEVPGGARIAQLSDPQGAFFALHENAKNSPKGR
jgi:predicted enzyme related to lactoylglutathione lyase